MAKKKSLDDVFYPVPKDYNPLQIDKPPVNKDVIKSIIQTAVKAAYELKEPPLWDYHGNPVKPKAVATTEQMEMISHLIESLQPKDAIEAALASQFAITYIRGLKESISDYESSSSMLDLFDFGHKVLETMNRYRTKGAQLINVQYNHNQGQINNYKIVDKEQPTIEVN